MCVCDSTRKGGRGGEGGGGGGGVYTEGPPTMALFRGGGQWEGIKRWGIEGIRTGTSDRFGRGRGE